MRNLYSLIALLFFFIPSIYGQGGVWTWISGESFFWGGEAVYGTKGVPSVNNQPGANYEMVEWKDKQGNFWLFGGSDPNYSDMWRFNPITLEWTWMQGYGNGATNVPASYGTQEVPGPNNTPGDISYGACTWTDSSGGFWLFGGRNQYENKNTNDLWRYDTGINEWTWVSGNHSEYGNHGIMGVPSASNFPGGRDETASAWTDSLNNLWLFGGAGYGDSSGSGLLNDLMKYNISTNQWTWVKGSNIAGAIAIYGTKQMADINNDPGGRMSYTKWMDKQGNFWIFGGLTYSFDLNDVWKYDRSDNEWIWMAGTNTVDDSGTYGAQCLYDSVFLPRARIEPRSSVTDNCGRFWLMNGYDPNSNVDDDLWLFDSQLLQWKLLSGSKIQNQSGSYGTKGVPSFNNIPPARAGANAWWGDDNRFYLFGGRQNPPDWDVLNDMWVFTPDTTCVPICNSIASPVASFQASKNSICSNECIAFSNQSNNATYWRWSFAGATPSSSSDQNPRNVCYSAQGTYSVKLIAYNSAASDTLVLNNYITVNLSPVVSVTADTVLCSGSSAQLNASGGVGYTWFPSSGLNDSASANPIASPVASTNYIVSVADTNGCMELDSVYITVYPLPVISLNTADTILCYGSSIQLTATGGTSYSWLPTTGLSDSTISNPTVTLTVATTYTVAATDSNGCMGHDSVTLFIYPVSPPVLITQVGHLLYCSTDTSYISYQWYDDSVLVANATDTVYVATHNGNYNVEVTDKYGCKSSAGINVDFTSVMERSSGYLISLYTNPVENQLTIYDSKFKIQNIEIYNVLGQIVLSSSPIQRRAEDVVIEVNTLTAGVYFVQVSDGMQRVALRFVKE